MGFAVLMVRVVSRAAPDDATPDGAPGGGPGLLRADARCLAGADQVAQFPNLPAKVRHALAQFPAKIRHVLAEFPDLYLDAGHAVDELHLRLAERCRLVPHEREGTGENRESDRERETESPARDRDPVRRPIPLGFVAHRVASCS